VSELPRDGTDMSHRAHVLRYSDVSTALALLNDHQLGQLVATAQAIGSGIGGTSALLDIAGVPVFVKRISLTYLERHPQNVMSTACSGCPCSASTESWRTAAMASASGGKSLRIP
jgi:hypothetical protein